MTVDDSMKKAVHFVSLGFDVRVTSSEFGLHGLYIYTAVDRDDPAQTAIQTSTAPRM
jgi:hypothetical protein